MKLTDREISGLPTILDVMELLAERENVRRIAKPEELHPWRMLVEGYYMPIAASPDKKLVQYLPTGPYYGLYYRGQNQYFEKCVPTLFRQGSYNEKLLSRLKANEFQLQVLSHPVVQELMDHKVAINLEALSQHYGFDTDRLDLTNDKWVAAFFASTQFKDGEYLPVGEGFGEGFGVLYASKTDITPFDPKFEMLMKRTDWIGFQFFPRPTSQSAYGFLINDGERFDDFSFFEKYYFRHEKKASEWVFEMSYRQRKFFPQDSLTQLADNIIKDKAVSFEALRRCQQNEYPSISMEDLMEICSHNGFQVLENSKYTFSAEEKKRDLEEWNALGKNVLSSKIITPRMVISTPLE